MAQYELNLRDYLWILRKRKYALILSLILFTALGWYYSSRQIAIYQAYTTVKIEERHTVSGLLTEWIAYNPADVIESQTKVIKGFPVLKAAALRLGLINENTLETDMHRAVKGIDSKIETEQIGRTNILKITVTSDDPSETVLLANTVAAVYVEHNLLEKNKQARTVRTFIEKQLKDLEQRMKDTEDELKTFSDQIKNIRVAQPIQTKLTELEFQLASLLQKYTAKHPRVIQLKQQIANLHGQVDGLSGEDVEYARLQREVEVDRKLYAMLKERLEQARITEAEKVPDVSIIDPAVMPRNPVNAPGVFTIFLGLFMGFVIGCVLAFFIEMSDTSIGTVEEVESVTGLPMLGVVPSVHYEIEGKRNIFAKLSSLFLKRDMNEEEEKFLRLLIHHKPASPIAESFRNIRTNLKISPQKKTFLITSSNPKEGKTAIATNLGLAIAQENMKTLLISSDLRRPQIARTFGIEREPGLTEVLEGSVTLKSVIRNITDIMLGEFDIKEALGPSGLRNIWILPSGSYPVNAAELLASKELVTIIEQLRKEFDCILFDSPPILPVTDAAVIAPLVDSVVLCYEVGRTSKSALLRAKSQLETVGATIEGLVLNHTKPETEPLEPYPYYYRYKNRYYRQEPTKKESSVA